MANVNNATTSNVRPRYQGYPYVDPPAFGVPSIDSETATRWANLPRRPIGLPVRIHEQPSGSGIQSHVSCEREPDRLKSSKSEPDDTPTVYIDLPESTDSGVFQTRDQTVKYDTDTIKSDITDPDENPVLYIDLPDSDESNVVDRRANDVGPQSKPEDIDEDVVYIDLPECSGSGVCERREEVEDGPSASVVQETILYDQFKDRRIEIPLNEEGGSSSSGPPQRPPPPNTLNLHRRQDSGTTITQSPLPRYNSPEDYRQWRSPEEFEMTSPVPEYREPPPAYTEIDNVRPPTSTPITSPITSPITPVSSVDSPTTPSGNTRTTVIVNPQTSNTDRKYMACSHCGMMVNSLVVKHTSFFGHFVAICLFFSGCCVITLLIYCLGGCKQKNHYCPNCHKLMRSDHPLKYC